MADPSALRYDLGATWLNLLGTVGRAGTSHEVERLKRPDLLVQWLGHENLTPRATVTEADVVQARLLRTGLRSLMLSTMDGRAPDPQAIATLNAFLAGEEPLRVTEDLKVAPPSTVAAALASIAREAVTHLTGPEAARLHICAAEECTSPFLDTSGRRRWCSPGTCGVKERVRAHRARRTSP